MPSPKLSTKVTLLQSNENLVVYRVVVGNICSPDLVPGYDGTETVEVSILRWDGSTGTRRISGGRGYAPDMTRVRDAARRAALRAFQVEA
jgi:hypothetical protein